MKKEIALIYDFDGTLTPANLPDHKLLPELGIDKDKFWNKANKITRSNDADAILGYMQLLISEACDKGHPLSKKILSSAGGPSIPLFDGVDTWFDRINKFSSKDYQITHYLISSGLHEIIATTKIAKYFKQIFACKYFYDQDGLVTGPAVAINYTTKTQYLFRINKGILNHYDDKGLNTWMRRQDRPVPFSRMIYLGDGDTDIPAMKTVRANSGTSIGLFDAKEWTDKKHQKKIYKLISEDRVNYVAPADYSYGSQLDVIIKGLIERIIREKL